MRCMSLYANFEFRVTKGSVSLEDLDQVESPSEWRLWLSYSRAVPPSEEELEAAEIAAAARAANIARLDAEEARRESKGK